MKRRFLLIPSLFLSLLFPAAVFSQDILPYDNGVATYHTAPDYRASESNPFRVAAYALHPAGWILREVIFRPLSYIASSGRGSRTLLGYKDPYYYRQPSCFDATAPVPDCRSVPPFNYYGETAEQAGEDIAQPEQTASTVTTSTPSTEAVQVYFPDVNFDFNSRQLNTLGKGRVRQIANLLKEVPEIHVILEGHADYIGSEEYNKKLGLDRAQAVQDELVRLGVSPDRLATVTFGKSQPIFTEKADWARAVNRRVEVHPKE